MAVYTGGCKTKEHPKQPTLVVSLPMIEQYHSDCATVVLVDHTGASVNKVLHCQPRPGRYACIGSAGNSY